VDLIQLVQVSGQWLSAATHVNELMDSLRGGEFVGRAMYC